MKSKDWMSRKKVKANKRRQKTKEDQCQLNSHVERNVTLLAFFKKKKFYSVFKYLFLSLIKFKFIKIYILKNKIFNCKNNFISNKI